MNAHRHIVIVGGGIAGLAAALRIRRTAPAAAVTVVEQSAILGGKLRTAEVGGVAVEAAAEMFLVRRPEALELARSVGLGDDLAHPATLGASVAVEGRLRPLPARTVMGIPPGADVIAGTGVLSPAGLARVSAEPDLPGEPLAEDVSVGDYARQRLGAQLVDRLVDPLLGGVYAGRAAGLSLRATVPTLFPPLTEHPSLVRAVRAAQAGPAVDGPVFATVRGGLSRLVDAAAGASGATIRAGLPIRELQRTPRGWRLVLGSTRDAEVLDADAVVLAVPAAPAARLLTGVSAAASAEIGAIDYASMALVTLVLPPTDLPAGSGALIPATSGLLTKAVTYVSQKWPLYGADVTVLRASIGRYGEEQVLQRDDDELVALVRTELGTLLGPLPEPRATSVARWGGALPQYTVGHLDRVRRARAALEAHPALALAGAAYDGVGIPACIASGEAAADHVLAALGAVDGRDTRVLRAVTDHDRGESDHD